MSKVGLFWNDSKTEERCDTRKETDASAKKAPSSEEAPNVALQSPSLGDAFFREKQQSTGVFVPAVVSLPISTTTTTGAMSTTTTATVTVTAMTTTTMTTVTAPKGAVVTTIHEETLVSVDTLKVEIERPLGAILKEKKTAKVRNSYLKKGDDKNQSRSYSAPAQDVALVGYLLSLHVVPSKAEASEREASTSGKSTRSKVPSLARHFAVVRKATGNRW
jgi:hypothetical protein